MPPPPIPADGDLPDIDGAFELEVIVRFDDIQGGYWQRIVDIGSGPGTDNILLTQYENTPDLMFALYQDGAVHRVFAPNAIVEGEEAVFAAGIEPDGLMWIEKDGVLLAEGQGVVPADVDRTNELLGASNWPGDGPLIGEVLGISIVAIEGTTVETDPVDPVEPVDPVDPVDPIDPENGAGQIDGPFHARMTARFDDVQGGYWQRVFDFGDGPASNNILFTQIENTPAVMLEIWQDGQNYNVIAESAIVEGETADWSVGIDADGLMWIEKDGQRLAEAQGVVPDDVERANLLIGQSNWPGDTALIGEVQSLEVVNGEAAEEPLDPTDPVNPVDPSDPSDPTDLGPPVSGAGDMILVAHQDDDLLFMNPTLDSLIDGDAPVTVVYITAGDAGEGPEYWGAREQGVKDAYAYMAGTDEWVDETVPVSVDGTTFDLASSYLASEPDIRMYFLRTPDGMQDGGGSTTHGHQSLEQLMDGSIASVSSVDGANTYSAEQLTGVVAALMNLHQPDHLHLQSDAADIEHTDHVHTTQIAESALADYPAEVTVTSYVSYVSWGMEENLTPAEETTVREAFDAYAAHDPHVRSPDGSLSEAYEEWVQREYVAEEYVRPALDTSAGGAVETMIAPPPIFVLPEDREVETLSDPLSPGAVVSEGSGSTEADALFKALMSENSVWWDEGEAASLDEAEEEIAPEL